MACAASTLPQPKIFGIKFVKPHASQALAALDDTTDTINTLVTVYKIGVAAGIFSLSNGKLTATADPKFVVEADAAFINWVLKLSAHGKKKVEEAVRKDNAPDLVNVTLNVSGLIATPSAGPGTASIPVDTAPAFEIPQVFWDNFPVSHKTGCTSDGASFIQTKVPLDVKKLLAGGGGGARGTRLPLSADAFDGSFNVHDAAVIAQVVLWAVAFADGKRVTPQTDLSGLLSIAFSSNQYTPFIQ